MERNEKKYMQEMGFHLVNGKTYSRNLGDFYLFVDFEKNTLFKVDGLSKLIPGKFQETKEMLLESINKAILFPDKNDCFEPQNTLEMFVAKIEMFVPIFSGYEWQAKDHLNLWLRDIKPRTSELTLEFKRPFGDSKPNRSYASDYLRTDT